MASSNFPFPEENSINRSLMINGEGYHYWKTRMQIFKEAIDLKIWECHNVPFCGRATRDSRNVCSTKGIRAESPPTFI